MEHARHPFNSSPTPILSRDPASPSAPDISIRPSEPMRSLFRYKRWGDAKLLEAALALPNSFPEPERGYVTAIIRHYHTVDCIFRAHLLGIPHGFTSANPPEPATLAELQQSVSAVDDWYVDYTNQLGERDLGHVLLVTFTDGQEQSLTRSDILLHVSQHGTGHRGQVALLMQKCGIVPPPDRFANFVRCAT